MKTHAFGECLQRESICLPASFVRFDRSALYWACLAYIRIARGNQHSSMSGDYLLAHRGDTISGHVGCPTELSIQTAIKESFGCFGDQTYLSAVSFAPGSRLRRISHSAFHSSLLRCVVAMPVMWKDELLRLLYPAFECQI
jgi:hypothetical protein